MKKMILLMILFLFVPLVSANDVVELKSGQKIEGEIIDAEDCIHAINFNDYKTRLIRYNGIKEMIKRIDNGTTAEKQVLNTFGSPKEVIGNNTNLEDLDLYESIKDVLISKEYPAPKPNEKILAYYFSFGFVYTGNLGAEWEEVLLLITINKDTGIVENHWYDIGYWYS